MRLVPLRLFARLSPRGVFRVRKPALRSIGPRLAPLQNDKSFITVRSKSFLTAPLSPRGLERLVHALQDASDDKSNTPSLGQRNTAGIAQPVLPSDTAGHPLSFDQLQYESDVASSTEKHCGLVDSPEHRHDFDLWIQLLQFRQRHNGTGGVVGIWNGLRSRNIDIPTDGPQADIFWKAFIRAGCKRKPFAYELWQYATELRSKEGRRYAAYYEEVLGYWLPKNPHLAYNWHFRLRDSLPPRSNALRYLVPQAVQSEDSLAVFRKLYKDGQERNLYDALISCLCGRGQFNEALRWHHFFLSMGDRPSPGTSNRLAVKRLNEYSFTIAKPTLAKFSHNTSGVKDSEVKLMRIHNPDQLEGTSDQSSTPGESVSTFIGAHSVQPKELDDKFCARLVATRAFPLDLIINGFAMFGAEAIGPFTLRELILREGTGSDLLQRIEQLKSAGISIGNSPFCKAVQKLIADGRSDLLRDVMSANQHPDDLVDVAAQKEYLHSSIATENWRSVHKTLMILTLFHAKPVFSAWNLLLQGVSKRSSKVMMRRLVEDMRLNNIPIWPSSLQSMYNACLGERRPGKRPASTSNSHKSLLLLTTMWYSILQSGGYIPPYRWREPLRRMGMLGLLDDLERLTLWLAAWYSPREALKTDVQHAMTFGTPSQEKRQMLDMAKSMHVYHEDFPLHQIFSPGFQKAVIEWGFKFEAIRLASSWKISHSRRRIGLGGVRHDDGDNLPYWTTNVPAIHSRHPTWAWGVRLIKKVTVHGVPVSTYLVRKALRKRLWMLFGPGRSCREENRIAAALNRRKLVEIVLEADAIWGGRIFHLAEKGVNSGAVASVTDLDQRLDIKDDAGEENAEDEVKIAAHRREKFLVRVFGERMWLKRNHLAVEIRQWARHLEAQQRVHWIGV